ncbi:hypothetical protein Ahy_B02g058300 [Arachis hypogaea]|uniref:3-oxo-5-alpha-steroid 4-dehydrogenase C-terminal domain-containing protein n=1 Tax=Arachis hypogaea TaxID=3818 RepID=A0A445AEC9_ARAHY|nr:hypothetical protein Ahy_B02g058300 [Arachis hypogaea]
MFDNNKGYIRQFCYCHWMIRSNHMATTCFCGFFQLVQLANLSFATVETHRWYHQKFKDYPSSWFVVPSSSSSCSNGVGDAYGPCSIVETSMDRWYTFHSHRFNPNFQTQLPPYNLVGRGKNIHSSFQSFFLHFYIVASIWTTFLLVTTWFYAYTIVPPVRESSAYCTITSYLIGGSVLRTAQVLRRLFEIIYVFKYSPSARMHILGYLTGMFFYLAAPMSLCADCALDVYYFLVILVTKFIFVGKDYMPPVETWMEVLDWRGYFFWGWIHQQRCHKILGLLQDSRHAEESAIPQGDWFEIVSSPHYLSETVTLPLPTILPPFSPMSVIYGRFVVATGGSDLTILLLLVFVLENLSFAAVETHRWYTIYSLR